MRATDHEAGASHARKLGARPVLSAALGVLIGVTLVTGAAIAHTRVECNGGTCNGDGHDNLVLGTGGFDDISAGGGWDEVFARGHGDHIHGDKGRDLLWSDAGDDGIRGNEGSDWYTCAGQNCGLEGLGGNDNIRGGEVVPLSVEL